MPALFTRRWSGRPDARNRAANTSMVLGTVRSIALISTSSPARVPAAVSTSRAGTTTIAPASRNARTVGTPMPDAPPVTIAVFPAKSMPAMTSSAVEAAPNPEPSGAWVAVTGGILADCDGLERRTRR